MVDRIKRIWMRFWFKEVVVDGHYVNKLNMDVVSNIFLAMIVIAIFIVMDIVI